MPSKARAECRDFSFYYGKEPVLDKISFTVQPGEWLSIIGPNGSGKSTLLKNMMRLVDGGESRGGLLIDGKPVKEYAQRELARKAAYVPQPGGRIPPFTVKDFISLSRYPYGSDAMANTNFFDEPVSRALELTGSAGLANCKLSALSGGQRQMVYLAAALAQTAPILLLDEPASFLDPRHAGLMTATLRKLHEQEDLTIICVTHDLNQALESKGKALVLKDGKQIFWGDVSRLAGGEGVLEEAFEHKFSYLVHPRAQKTLVVS